MATAALPHTEIIETDNSAIIYSTGVLREWRFSNILEILRLYAERYCRLAAHIEAVGMQATMIDSGPSEQAMGEQLVETLIPILAEMRKESERIGLEASSDAISNVLLRWKEYGDVRLFKVQTPQLLITIENELRRRVCFILPRSSQALYENPCEEWESILAVFPDARGDVDEMNRCMAFNRYPAAVFHVLLAVEHGIVALGKFVGATDLKPGWDVTCNAVEKILQTGRKSAAPDIVKHFAFLELVNKDMQSMKMAWRNKVSHAANHLFLMTSDFKPEVAKKIISSCHGFMLLMATEGPNKTGHTNYRH